MIRALVSYHAVNQREQNIVNSGPGQRRSQLLWRSLRVAAGLPLILLALSYRRLFYVENPPVQYVLLGLGGVLVASAFVFLIPDRFRLSRYAWFRRIYRERFSMPRETMVYLVIMIVLAAGSMLGHSNTLLLVFALMCGPFILNGWYVYAMLQRVRVDRGVPFRASAGETFSVKLTLHNDRRRLAGRLIRVEDRISNGHESLSGRVLFFRVAGRSARSASYRVRLMQRGVYKFGPVLVGSRFPFGLGERGRYFETHSEVIVHPIVGQLAPAWWQTIAGDGRVVDRQRARLGQHNDELHQIREYRPGDAVRSIHWRTTARLNTPMVREFQQSREHDAIVLVDLWRGEGSHEDDVETAASFAATVCRNLMKSMSQASVGFFLSGEKNVSVTGPAESVTWDRILDALAVAKADRRADRGWLLGQSAAINPNIRPILITTRSAQVATADLNGSTPVARNAVVVSVRDDEFERIFAPADGSVAGLPQEVPA